MATALERLLLNWPRTTIGDTDIVLNLPGTANSRYGRIKRSIASKLLIPARKGLYVIGEDIRGKNLKINPFELAGKIYSPSFISLESALSYHGLIPEAVYSITSVCTKRKKNYETSFGYFTYQTVPAERFYEEVERVSENNQEFFIAKPWRALFDYIYCHKTIWKNLTDLSDYLRLDISLLPPLSEETRNAFIDYYHHSKIKIFLENLPTDKIT